jgi:glycosyltransferase 2 family protein
LASDRPISVTPGDHRGTFAKRTTLLLLRLTFGVGILVYLARSGKIDLRGLWNLVIHWPITVTALTFLVIDALLMAMRTSLLFRAMRLHLSLANATRLTLVAFFFSTFLPGAAGGDIAKVYYAAKENHGQRAEVAAILLFDRMIGLLSLLLLPLIAAPFFPRLIQSLWILRYVLLIDFVLTSCLICGLALLMNSARVREVLSLESISWLGERNIVSRIVATIAAFRRAPAAMIRAFGLSLLANCSLIIVTWLAAVALHPIAVPGKLFLIAPIGHLVNSLPLTPGGLGVGETAFAALFTWAGISGGAETLLCWRVWNAMVGLIGMVIYLFGMGRIVHGWPVTARASEAEDVFAGFADADDLRATHETLAGNNE